MRSGTPLCSKSKRRGFFRRQDGSVTVEFIVWMPVFLAMLAFIADACTIYLIQASMWNVAMDCARRMSVGQYKSTDASPNDVTTACVQKELLYAYKPYTITPTFGTDDKLEVSLPLYEASVFGVLVLFSGLSGPNYKLDVTATMRAE
jgi:Flp pilus assembly protein TadG